MTPVDGAGSPESGPDVIAVGSGIPGEVKPSPMNASSAAPGRTASSGMTVDWFPV